MSLIGILSSNLFSYGVSQLTQSRQSTQSAAKSNSNSSILDQLKTDFQQLSQDLQSGNLAAAQQDYATISQTLPGANQAAPAQSGAASAASGTGSTANVSPIIQAFTQLGQDLQSGNLQAARQDYATVQQDALQSAQQTQGYHRHHRHHHVGSENAQAGQQANGISQAFNQLAQSLQSGNLSGAQSAFATLQSDLQQIGGFVSPGGSAQGTGAAAAQGASLNVSA